MLQLLECTAHIHKLGERAGMEAGAGSPRSTEGLCLMLQPGQELHLGGSLFFLHFSFFLKEERVLAVTLLAWGGIQGPIPILERALCVHLPFIKSIWGCSPSPVLLMNPGCALLCSHFPADRS